MPRMPETSINLPIPASGSIVSIAGHGVRRPRNEPESAVSSSLLTTVSAYIDGQDCGEGLFPTPVDGINIIRSFQQRMPTRQIYRPSLCVVLQGAKQILFGEDVLDYGAMEYLLVSVALPASGRVVTASPEAPFIGMTIDLDVTMMRDVLEQLDTPPLPADGSGHCVSVGKVDEALADCIVRLIRLFDRPKAVPILYPSVMREICYWLLSGPHGAEFRSLTMPESNMERVAKAIYFMRDNYAQTVRVERLAEVARMSPSSFHQHFKALTSLSPLQFQKELRLLEARRLMVADAASVTEAAYHVGYESASQFSREYSRMFGVAPKNDAMTQRRLYSQYASRTLRSA